MTVGWIVLFVALWIVVIGLVVLVLGLVGKVHKLEGLQFDDRPLVPARSGPALGDRLPSIPGFERVLGPDGAPAGKLLLFLSSSCGPCLRFADTLRTALRTEAGRRLSDAATLVVVTDAGGRAVFGSLEVAEVVVEEDGEVTRALDIPGTPFVVAVTGIGVVQAATYAHTFAQVAGLVDAGTDATLSRA